LNRKKIFYIVKLHFMLELRGITWDHTRGFLPVVAAAQRFAELHPDVAIAWEKRSLQQFADVPVEQLARRFDLLVIDHPFVGFAADCGCLLPLDAWLPAEFLADQAANSVGRSHESYAFGGRQWALAIDAAAPVSGWRPDLLEAARARVPETWLELLGLARRGLVALPGAAVDSLMHFYMLCLALGEEPFSGPAPLVSPDTGIRALSLLRELAQSVSPVCAAQNPIAIWETLSSGDSVAFCPFAYGYSNYARRGYAPHTLEFGGLVALEGRRCRSTLGGAGLAVSSRCRHPEPAIAYCRYVAAADCQTGLYFESGGQPGYRQAWLDPEPNRRTGNFFRNTLATLDEAWLRPRWNGYLDFQDAAGPLVHDCVWRDHDPAAAMHQLNDLAARANKSAHLEHVP
jgi:multiple sugar transport system substrate-binding protein